MSCCSVLGMAQRPRDSARRVSPRHQAQIAHVGLFAQRQSPSPNPHNWASFSPGALLSLHRLRLSSADPIGQGGFFLKQRLTA